jgi:hypothetical protein
VRAIQVTASSTAERRRAHDLLARTCVALGQNAEAVRTFLALLSTDPNAPTPQDASPTIRRLFLDAKGQLYPKGVARLRQLPSLEHRLTFELIDPWSEVAKLELHEGAWGGAWTTTVLTPSPTSNVDLKDDTAHCFVAALSASGDRLGALGSLEAPLSCGAQEAPKVAAAAAPPEAVAVSPAPAPAARARWPIWAAAGGAAAFVVLGASLTGAAAANSQAAGTQHFASDARALDVAARTLGITGTIAFCIAAAAAVTAGILFFTW